MKNIRLIAFLFNVSFSLLGWGKMLVWAEQNKMLLEDSTVSGKISFPFMEIRGAVDKPFGEQRYNYGLMLTSKPFSPLFPVTLKAGNLSAGGSLSRLNSPELLQTISAFGQETAKSCELTISLPSDSNFSKPQAVSIQFETGNKERFLSGTTFYDKATITQSLSFKLMPINQLKLGFCFTGGIYEYKTTNTTAWFMQFFNPLGSHLCSNFQFSVSFKNLSSVLTINTYETPQGNFKNTYRIENSLQVKNLLLNVNGYLNYEDKIITSTSKNLSPLLQLQTGAQYKIKLPKLKLTILTGINAQTNIILDKKENNSKTALGIKLTGPGFSGYITTNNNFELIYQNKTNYDFTDGNVKGGFAFAIYDFKTQISTGFYYTTDSKHNWNYSEKLGINFEYSGIPDISWNNSLTLSQKKENKLSFTSSLNVKAQFRFCSLRVHLEFQV